MTRLRQIRDTLARATLIDVLVVLGFGLSLTSLVLAGAWLG